MNRPLFAPLAATRAKGSRPQSKLFARVSRMDRTDSGSPASSKERSWPPDSSTHVGWRSAHTIVCLRPRFEGSEARSEREVRAREFHTTTLDSIRGPGVRARFCCVHEHFTYSVVASSVTFVSSI